MKKKLYTVIFTLILLTLSTSFAFAKKDRPRLVDKADLLSDSAKTELLGMLDEISERQRLDLVIVTKKSLNGKTPREAADDFYDKKGYGFGDGKDGILFLISMEERDWYISTSGFGITAVTDAGREYMAERFLYDLGEGEYAAAFTSFAQLCDDFIAQARTGEPYDVDHLPKEPFEPVLTLILALFISFVISLIVTGSMKGKLKSVHSRPEADSYVKNGSVKLTKVNDLFLYSHVERREKPKDQDDSNRQTSQSGGSKTHVSSSGKTHGGGGGKF